jgi:hypothetical protein
MTFQLCTVSHTKVFHSIWRVVDAINKCPQLAFKFLKDHTKQEEISIGFLQRSEPKFLSCVGCIDGMLLWIEQATAKDCEITG